MSAFTSTFHCMLCTDFEHLVLSSSVRWRTALPVQSFLGLLGFHTFVNRVGGCEPPVILWTVSTIRLNFRGHVVRCPLWWTCLRSTLLPQRPLKVSAMLLISPESSSLYVAVPGSMVSVHLFCLRKPFLHRLFRALPPRCRYHKAMVSDSSFRGLIRRDIKVETKQN